MHIVLFILVMLASALAIGVFTRVAGGSWGQAVALGVGTLVVLQILYLALIFGRDWLKSRQNSGRGQ
ncbi:hypothetical protein LY56_01449 [Roseinatronobacter thiooxidans]|jgi:uncharacterized membrane protein|uniref:Uncharacterized protein n=1 Tax=Roseinatronobacter thiooxidans TaxID=121821 RepID=A0A2W7QER1_9RHOB|nr:hypothetical protein [Roseinatronobacter thiooxidans]PZX45886.1 hypothetical protein LY56_01449 [Roseinatronobacter thiooxidans]